MTDFDPEEQVALRRAFVSMCAADYLEARERDPGLGACTDLYRFLPHDGRDLTGTAVYVFTGPAAMAADLDRAVQAVGRDLGWEVRG